MITDFRTRIPEGQSGDWKIQRFIVTEQAASLERLRAIFSSNRGRGVPEGTYTKLTRNGQVIMSDTPDEIRDHRFFVYRAKGKILVNGLGLGIVVELLLDKDEVDHITVIEISRDVIVLVGKYLKDVYGDRLTIIEADALTWKPPKGVKYNSVWHDIWDNICSDNLEEMKTLHRRYGRRADWQGSWCRDRCEYLRDMDY